MSMFGGLPIRSTTTPGFGGGTAASSPVWSMAMAVFSQLSQAYASFAAVRSAQGEAKSQASALSHRARMLDLDRRAARLRAESILEQGHSEIANLTLEGGQRRGAIAASQAAAGIDSSAGSAAEVLASDKVVDAIDVYHINLASVRAANAAGAEAVAIGNEATLTRASSRNFGRTARGARPEAQLVGGLLSGVAAADSIYNYRRRR